MRGSALRNQHARRFVIDLVPSDAVCAEIGVWKGDFSQTIAEWAKPRALHLVDPWAFNPTFPKRWYGGRIAKSQTDMDAIYEGVLARMSGYDGVVLHRMASVEAAALFEDSAFDWVYIDGDHSYEAVKADLTAWKPKVKPGGVLAGDDVMFGGASGELPVKRAVEEFAAESGLDAPVIRNGQFVFSC